MRNGRKNKIAMEGSPPREPRVKQIKYMKYTTRHSSITCTAQIKDETNMSGSEAVLQRIDLQKVSKLYLDYPGGAIMPVYDALYDFQ